MILDFIAFADEALLVPFTHMGVQLVAAEEAFSTELAKRMNAALDLMLLALIASMTSCHGGHMNGKDIRVVQRVFVGENLLEPYA